MDMLNTIKDLLGLQECSHTVVSIIGNTKFTIMKIRSARTLSEERFVYYDRMWRWLSTGHPVDSKLNMCLRKQYKKFLKKGLT